MRHVSKLAVCATTIALSAACSVAQDETAGTPKHDGPAPVQADSNPAFLTLSLESGNAVSFHEAGTIILVSESGRLGTPSVLEEWGLVGLPALDVYEALRPGEAVPTELLEAFQRTERQVDALVEDDEVETDELAPAVGGGSRIANGAGKELTTDVGQISQAITESYFLNELHGCRIDRNPTVYHVCYPSWWNGFFAYAHADYAYWRVASDTGNWFHARITANNGGEGGGDYYVAQGHWRGLSAAGERCSRLNPLCVRHARTLRIDIINAANDKFHVGGYWWMETAD